MNLEKTLKSNGYSLTQPRRSIFSYLQGVDKPVGINEILDASATIDRSTVYRTLELFEKLGVTKKVWFGYTGKIELSENFKVHHHHVVCESCGSMKDVESINLERLLRKITKKTGFMPTKHSLELFGLCENCRAKKG